MHRDGKYICGCQGLVKGEWRVAADRHRASFEDDEISGDYYSTL